MKFLLKIRQKRSDKEKTQLKRYYYQLMKMDKNIIQEVLKKCPDLKKKAKTVAQRKSASRSAQNEDKKEVETEKRKQWMRQSRRGQYEEKKEVEREKAKQGMTEIHSMEDPETREKRLHDINVHNKNKRSMEDPETREKRRKQHTEHTYVSNTFYGGS